MAEIAKEMAMTAFFREMELMLAKHKQLMDQTEENLVKELQAQNGEAMVQNKELTTMVRELMDENTQLVVENTQLMVENTQLVAAHRELIDTSTAKCARSEVRRIKYKQGYFVMCAFLNRKLMRYG